MPVPASLAAQASMAGVDCQSFEFSSRGDRVAGRLLTRASATGSTPLILLQPSAGTWRWAGALDAAAARWLEAGAAVASIDLPLHGERASAKLSERLMGALRAQPGATTPAPAELDPVARLLRIEFTRQAVIDLGRGFDAAAQLTSIDPQRVAFVGFGVSASVGALFCALDPRPAVAALAPAADRPAPAEIDPRGYIGEIAPRPLLVLGDYTPAATSARSFFEAAGEPKQIESFGGSPLESSAPALETLWRFLATHLSLEDESPPHCAG
jgi:dienelactone hydrolase